MNRRIRSILVILLAIICGCKEHNSKSRNAGLPDKVVKFDPHYKKMNFDTLMADINIEIGGTLDKGEDLTTSSKFMEIYNHDSNYLANAINSIAKEKYTGWQLHTCIFAMQNLSINDYIRFCNVFVQLYEKNKISEAMLQEAIFPNFLNKKIISNNSTNPQVVTFLNKLRKDHKLSKEFNDEIEDSLSG